MYCNSLQTLWSLWSLLVLFQNHNVYIALGFIVLYFLAITLVTLAVEISAFKNICPTYISFSLEMRISARIDHPDFLE